MKYNNVFMSHLLLFIYRCGSPVTEEARVSSRGALPSCVIAAVPDIVSPQWKIPKVKRRVEIARKTYILGGITYYNMTNHYNLKLYKAPNYENHIIYDDMKTLRNQKRKIAGRPNLYMYFMI
jgi:hypothetical protein